LRAFGFYVKKIFLPLPLNFAIVEVDPLYELLAVPVLLLLTYLFMKRSMAGAYLLTGSALISPAFPIAFNQIAWTPYAERYVYLALGFVLPAVVFYARQIKLEVRYVLAGLLIVSLLFLSITSHRSWQWRTNQTLWADTAQKSPLCEKALNNYGVVLCGQGRYEEAQELFDRVARRKYSNFRYNDKYDVNVAVAMMGRKDYEKACEKLFYAIENSKGVSSRAVDVYLEIAGKQPGSQRDHVINKLRDRLALWAEKTGKAGYFYQLGRLEKYLNNQESACEYFRKAHAATRDPDPMWAKAAKALEEYGACPRPE
jgi:tetratricopeptide (TPR) repeat protein